MRALLNIALLCGYAGLAGATAFYGPGVIPQLDQDLAFGVGGLIFVVGALLHEIYARTGCEANLGKQLLSLSYGYANQQDELTWMRREVDVLREALDSANQSGELEGGGRTLKEVMAEVKVLKSLIPRLSTGESPLIETVTDAEWSEYGSSSPGAAAPVPPGELPPVAQDMDREQVLNVVRIALRDDRIDMVLQPIVSLPQRRRRYYECFSRLHTGGGAMILPGQYITIAERAGLITAIDNMLLFRCIQLIRKVHRKSQDIDFFCNISPHTVADVDFFGDFIDFLQGNRDLPPHLIFEFSQADFSRWSEAGAQLLDRVRDLNLDAAALAARQIKFVKIECDLLLDHAEQITELRQSLRRNEIDLIVEKVEDDSQLLELLDYEIDFGQGFLFGEPRLARPAG
jgi:cyclic-di-GMP phosphodiesterase TipF (flagellum assembly factor)